MTAMTQRNASPRVAVAPIGLDLRQLIGRHDRLERELACSFAAHPLQSALIERLVEEVAATQREIERIRASQEGLHEELRLAA
jgi:hypothetical protein